MFPEGAFYDHAKKKLIFGAVEEGRLLGYILFRITHSKQIVCITHLCVNTSYRNKGVAQNLLNAVRDKYVRLYRGISLSCRKDYKEASRFWELYGFKAIHSKRSKSKTENYLIKWWYDFGNSDLFSNNVLHSPKINALLDSNIIMKISDNNCNENQEALALIADWLNDETDYYFAPEVFNEINRDTNLSRANATRSYVHNLREARFNPEERNQIIQQLHSIIKGKSSNDESDKKQLAECISAGIDYFITLDTNLLNVSEGIYERFSVKVLRPADFVLHIDYNIKGKNYHSFRVAGANYTYSNIKEAELEDLVDACSLNVEKGEKKHHLRQRLTSVIANVQNSTIRIVRDNNRLCLGYFAVSIAEKKLSIKILRTANKKIADILFQQLIKDILSIGVEKECAVIEMEEELLSEERKLILTSFGFECRSNAWIKIILTGQLELVKTITTNKTIGQFWDVPAIVNHFENLQKEENNLFKLSLERKLWPVKFIDAEVPVYIVPIKPYWAGQLFDYYIAGNSLFGATPELSWLKENIYYRSVRPVTEIAPGRILWYVSTEENGISRRDKSIVATSYLEEVHTGPAKILFQKFKNFGVYEWRDISKLANNDPLKEIKVLKFGDTEVFKKTVPLTAINGIMKEFGRPINTFPSPVEVTSEIFNAIYLLGKK